MQSTKSPGRARFQSALQEGIWRKVTVCRLQVTWGGGCRGGGLQERTVITTATTMFVIGFYSMQAFIHY